jgi:hypothetical protein
LPFGYGQIAIGYCDVSRGLGGIAFDYGGIPAGNGKVTFSVSVNNVDLQAPGACH